MSKLQKNTETMNPKLIGNKNGRTMLLSKCAVCGAKKYKFIKKQEAKRLLSNLGIRIPLNKIPILGDVFFDCNSIECNSFENYKMDDIIDKFLLAGDKYMPEMHLWQHPFTYSACGPFTKNKERIQKLKKETRDSRYIYRNGLDKAWFQHDMTYGDFTDLGKITTADKILRDKAFNVAKDPKDDGYQRGLTSMIYKFFDKKLRAVVLNLCRKMGN